MTQSPHAINCLSNPASQTPFLLPTRQPGVCSQTIPHQDHPHNTWWPEEPSKTVYSPEGWGSRPGGEKLRTLSTSRLRFIPDPSPEMNSKQPKGPKGGGHECSDPSRFHYRLSGEGQIPTVSKSRESRSCMVQLSPSFSYHLSLGLSEIRED